MTLPALYVEGLRQRALRGEEQLNRYKLGLIEALLKETLDSANGVDTSAIQSSLRTALDVVQWEMRGPRGPGVNTRVVP